MMTDQQIIEGLRLNDNHIIGHFYSQSRKKFMNYFRTTYGKTDYDYLNDLYQDSFVSVWENAKLGKLNKMTSTLTTYLFAVGEHKMMAHDRKYKGKITKLDPQKHNWVDSDTEEIEEKEEKERKIDEIVDKMTYPCSDILRMHYWENLSGEEIAVQMKYASADAVKSQKYKCIQKLKKAVEAIF